MHNRESKFVTSTGILFVTCRTGQDFVPKADMGHGSMIAYIDLYSQLMTFVALC